MWYLLSGLAVGSKGIDIRNWEDGDLSYVVVNIR